MNGNTMKYTVAQWVAQKGTLSVSSSSAILLTLIDQIARLHQEGKLCGRICENAVYIDGDFSVLLDYVESPIIFNGIEVNRIPYPPQLNGISFTLPLEIKSAQSILIEQGILLDPRQIDIYQLGALFCFMVSGRQIRDYLRSCKAKADVPERVRPVIDCALGLNPKNRFKTAEMFASALKDIPTYDSLPGQTAMDLPASLFTESPLKTPAHRTDDVKESLPFKKLGHYQIISRIGCGGMGDVYKGYEEGLSRHVAVKVLAAELTRNKDFVKRFHAEAAAIAKLNHPNIVQVYYSGEDMGVHFFAMQYIDGESLADLLVRRQKLNIDEAMQIIEQALAGIGAVHQCGLVHRDIKPGNILLDSRGKKAMVTDFGVVKSDIDGTQLTTIGTVLGTADYVAPEQARGGTVDGRADLYAMGVMMYQILSGRLPFDAKSSTSMMFQHVYESPPLLSDIAPEIPNELAGIIMKLMAKDPDQRYQSAQEVLLALHTIHSESVAPSTSLTETSRFYGEFDCMKNLCGIFHENRGKRLWRQFVEFIIVPAQHIIGSLQTTSQQVDGAIAELQKRRENLVKLKQQARTVTADLEAEAKKSTNAAKAAAYTAQTASSNTAMLQALKEKQDNEQVASELLQLASEQTEQSETIDLQLMQLEATLARLCSQQDALNARMCAIGPGNQSNHNRFIQRVRWKRLSGAVIIAASILVLSLLMLHRINVPVKPPTEQVHNAGIIGHANVTGYWNSVDFVHNIEDFNPSRRFWDGSLYLTGLDFQNNGQVWCLFSNNSQVRHSWTPGRVETGESRQALYEVKNIDDHQYMFFEWISGDVTIRGKKTSYYVLEKMTTDGLSTRKIIVGAGYCTMDFIESILGRTSREEERMLRYPAQGVDFCFTRSGILSEAHFNPGFRGQLETGISLMSTKDDVFRVYGSPIETREAADLHRIKDERILYQKGNTSRIYYGQHGLVFWFYDSTVSQIVIFKGEITLPHKE